jgi:predicted TIM-barrel fold metal-dependent hydrolase
VTATRVVDSHVHCAAGRVEELLRVLDVAGIDGAVVVTFPGEAEAVLEEALRLAPGRLRVLVAPDIRLAGTTAWEPELARMDQLLASAAGIKLYKQASFGVRNSEGSLVSLLSPELEPLWAMAAARGRPVLLHCGDPADFWRRTPRLRSRQLEVHPGFRYRDLPEVPSRRWMIRCRDELFRRHPEVRFVGAHLGGFPATPAELTRFLRLGAADTSAALEEILTFDRPAVERIVHRHERDILWGSDVFVTRTWLGDDRAAVKLKAKFLADSLRMVTAAETVHVPAPHQFPWRAPGLGLTGPRLESVLHGNADRIYWSQQ